MEKALLNGVIVTMSDHEGSNQACKQQAFLPYAGRADATRHRRRWTAGGTRRFGQHPSHRQLWQDDWTLLYRQECRLGLQRRCDRERLGRGVA